MEHRAISRLRKDDVRRFSFDSGEIMISDDDLNSYKDAHKKTTAYLNRWKINREFVESELHSLAEELDVWERNINITSVVGGALGAIALIVAAPAAFVGLVIRGSASVTALVAYHFNKDNIEKNLHCVKELLEKDRKLTEELMNSIGKLNEKKSSIIPNKYACLVSDVNNAVSSTGKEPISLRLKESALIYDEAAVITTNNMMAAMSMEEVVGPRAEVAQQLRRIAEDSKKASETSSGPAVPAGLSPTMNTQEKWKMREVGEKIARKLAIFAVQILKALEKSSSATEQTKSAIEQNKLLTAKEELEYGRKLTETLSRSFTTLEETEESILSSHQIRVTKDIGVNLNKEALMSRSKIGTVSIASGAVRLVLRKPTTVSSAVAKGAFHAITAAGIAIDALAVALSVKGLMTGSRSEIAQQLRGTAEELKSSRESITRDFLMTFSELERR